MTKTRLLKHFLLLFALIAGSMSVWADDVLVYTLDGTITGGTNGYDTESSITQNGMRWGVVGNTTTNPWRIGGKSLDAVDRDITGQDGFTEALSKVTVNHAGTTSDNLIVNSVKLTVATDADYSNVIDVVTLSPTIGKNTAGSFSFTPTSPLMVWSANCYYKITINVSNSKSSNYGFQPTAITFYKEVAVTATTTTIDASGITNTNIANGTEAGSLSATVKAGNNTVSGATVSWTSSDEDVAIIDNDGVVTLVAPGTTTITASYAGDGTTYGASSDTYELEVTDSRAEAGLAYEVTEQSVIIGEVLDAPTLTNPYSLTVNYYSGNEDIATVDANGNVTGVAPGTTTITAMFAGNSIYRPGSASYTIKVKKSGALFYEGMSGYTGASDVSTELTPTNANLDSQDWESFTKVYAGKVLSGDANGHLKFGTSSVTGKAVTKSIDLNGSGTLIYKVQRYDSKESGNLTITVSGATAEGDVDVTGTDSWVEKRVYLTEATGNVVITFETTSSGKRIRVDDITLLEGILVPASVTSYKWATFSSDYALDFTNVTDVEAYIVKGANGTAIDIDKVTGTVAAGTGLVLYSETAGTYNIPAADEGTDYSSTNKLIAVTEDNTTIGVPTAGTNYVLAVQDGKAVFAYIANVEATLNKGKAYLHLDGAPAAPYLSFEGGETTGIVNVNRETITNNQYYTLDGRRVENPSNGVYIVNGKKVVIK